MVSSCCQLWDSSTESHSMLCRAHNCHWLNLCSLPLLCSRLLFLCWFVQKHNFCFYYFVFFCSFLFSFSVSFSPFLPSLHSFLSFFLWSTYFSFTTWIWWIFLLNFCKEKITVHFLLVNGFSTLSFIIWVLCALNRQWSRWSRLSLGDLPPTVRE